MCDSTRGLDALLQPHPGREREKESRNSVSGRSAHLRAFRPPWMVMAGEKSGVCEPRVFPKIVIILVHKSFSNLLKFWVPHFQANPFDPRAHVTHNGWSPFYTCLLGYLIRTHGILCSEHHRKNYNEPGLNTCLGWWGNDPATQKIIRCGSRGLPALPQLYLSEDFSLQLWHWAPTRTHHENSNDVDTRTNLDWFPLKSMNGGFPPNSGSLKYIQPMNILLEVRNTKSATWRRCKSSFVWTHPSSNSARVSRARWVLGATCIEIRISHSHKYV